MTPSALSPPAHPLDQPVWSALTGRQSDRAQVMGSAIRLDPAFGLFAATPDLSRSSLTDLGRLIGAHGEAALFETGSPSAVPGVLITATAACWQMVASALTASGTASVQVDRLGPADAADMLDLATVTQPGPFRARTGELGGFVGVREGGRLIAMAGERLRPDGFTEVSGVCTAPDQRGRGLAGALMRVVASEILARGELPFLHSYAHNTGAIRLYESLGFRHRATLTLTSLAPAPKSPSRD
ncbi:MAG: GNAT family N-acetyltransferase [Caulobacter sp.]|nr:GNAT family N-acetyltransferase [Caulobacter sp.]